MSPYAPLARSARGGFSSSRRRPAGPQRKETRSFLSSAPLPLRQLSANDANISLQLEKFRLKHIFVCHHDQCKYFFRFSASHSKQIILIFMCLNVGSTKQHKKWSEHLLLSFLLFASGVPHKNSPPQSERVPGNSTQQHLRSASTSAELKNTNN